MARQQPNGHRLPQFLLLVTAAVALASPPAAASVPYVVEFLSGKQLEHQTQASTGQTTGWWFVAFLSNHCMQCGAAAAALDSAASRAEGSVVWAKMNCNHHPDVVKRFGIRSFPHLVLFKDRQMFVYPSGGELAPDAFAAFVDAAGAVEEGLEVPPPASLTDELQDLLQEWMEEAPLLVYAAFGLAALLLGGTCMSLAFPRGKFSKEE